MNFTSGSLTRVAPRCEMRYFVQAGMNQSTKHITATNTSPFTIELISVNASGNTGYNTNFNPYQGYSWTLLTSASPITGFNASDFTVNTSLFNSGAVLGSQFSVTEGATDLSLVLNFTPVPEPSTWALMAGGVCMLSVAVLRRLRAAAARS